MTAASKEIGWQTERVADPFEVIPALERVLAANQKNRPAYGEIIASQYPVYGDWAG